MELYIPCRHLEVEPSLQHLHLLWLVSGAGGTGLLAYTLVFCSLDKMQPPAGCTLPGAGSRKQVPQVAQYDHTVNTVGQLIYNGKQKMWVFREEQRLSQIV